jgi:predicted O-linked N-acetylglucosamine transferase (SPINDLY family)
LELYRQVRQKLFDFILQLDDEAIMDFFPNFIEPAVKYLSACQDYHRFPYQDEEQEKITSTVQRCNELLQSRNSSGVMQCLLALRLYKMPHELDIPFDRFNVSGFFSRYYLCDFFNYNNYKWCFAIHTDESDRNYRLQEVRLKLLAEICQRSPEIVSVVEQYLSCNHGVAIFQSTHDGKQIFIYYNKIIQYYLSSKSIATEWDFPLNSYSKDNKRIKAGLICKSLCMPDSSAAIPYIQSLDRNRFEIYIYTYDESSLESDFCPSGLTVKVLDQNLSSNIEAIRSDDLDILIFGHNINLRLLDNICLLGNCRVARIQVCTPLCPTTTGRKHIDYFISGNLSEINSGQDAYTEKLITIEGSGLCFRKTDVDVSTCEYTRAQFNLPIDAVVYGSGANLLKSSPSARRVWLQVLKHISNSFLVLYPFHSGWIYSSNIFTISYKRAVTRLAEELEINPDRIIFIYEKFPTRTDLVKFLQSVVDVYLDSFPYSGAFSLLDPLDAHIPVVTLKGKYLRQAQGGALLEELGLPELVAHDEQSYLDLALKLGRDQEFRATCSQKIKEGMINPPFRNCELFAQKLEKVYIDFVKVWRTQKLIKDAENNLKAGQIDQAYINYQLALELEPANPSALTGMGTISVQRGNLSEAESYYRQAISADETFAKAYWNLANLLSKSGNKEEANNFKQKAIELEPELAEIAYQQYTALAQSSLGNSNFTEAINLYRQALAVKPNDLVINETLAKILLASPWRRDAQPYIEVAQTLGTTDTAILGRNTDRFDLLDNLSISKQILYSSSNLDNEKVNFVYTVNRKSIDATLVSLYSIYHNNQSLNVSINLITEDLDLTDSIDKVINLARSLNIDCNLYRVTPEPWLSTNLLPAIPRIINDVDENIIYLASNTIVLKDISSLSQIELGSKFLVATPCGRNTLVKSILPISLGMAIINLKEWRKSNLGDIVLEMLYQHGNELSLEEAFNLTIDRFFFDRLFTLHPGYYHYLSSNQDSLPAKVMVIGYEINESKFSLYDYYYTNLVSYLH